MDKNADWKTIESFGDEWERFDQRRLSDEEAKRIFQSYFSIFPWSTLPSNAIGFDMGCGSGRWARLVAPHVGHLHCIDPSSALERARGLLEGVENVTFHAALSSDHPLPDSSQDFGYSLGVLHHVPDTRAAIMDCVRMLKPGAPFLVYLYYSLDNRPVWFRRVWLATEWARSHISSLRPGVKRVVTDVIAVLVYYPLARASRLLEWFGISARSIPLSHYKDLSFLTMRTDSRDRFGTPLEQRFSREQIREMMETAGLSDIRFSENAPYWCAVGRRA